MPFRLSRLPAVNVASVPQRSPLRYPGGKTWLIPHIRQWLAGNTCDTLIEPFAGGGIVTLTAVAEHLVKRSVMVEIDRDVAAFWHAALRDGAAMARRVRGCRPTRDMLRDWEATGARDVFEHGFRTLVLNRTRRAGILANGASYMREGEGGRGLLSRWYPETLARRLAEISVYAERIDFVEGDGLRLLPTLIHGSGSRAAVFADPPYTAGGKRAGSRLYKESELDHEALFDLMAKSDVNFLLTYDAAPEIIDLVRRHRFHAVRVEMQNAHGSRLPELVISRDALFE